MIRERVGKRTWLDEKKGRKWEEGIEKGRVGNSIMKGQIIVTR